MIMKSIELIKILIHDTCNRLKIIQRESKFNENHINLPKTKSASHRVPFVITGENPNQNPFSPRFVAVSLKPQNPTLPALYFPLFLGFSALSQRRSECSITFHL